MTISIFCSRQSDTPNPIGRGFVGDALERALKSLSTDLTLLSAVREEGLALEKDTKGCLPSVEEMTRLLERPREVVPVERLWANPDCGLKTRAWPETQAALANMVEAAHIVRARAGARQQPTD